MKLLRLCALLAVLSILSVLPALAAEPGDYGYYDSNYDGKIEIADVLTSLHELLNDPESSRSLRQVLRTVKTVTTSDPVEATLLSVNTEAGTVTLSCDALESFEVPFATLGLTADTDFDALLNQSVNLTVPSPAADFFANYDAGKLLAGRPVPLIKTEEPETPTAPAVQDITFSPSGTYLKFTITPPADETGIAKYEIRMFEDGNDTGRIGWPVNAEYCEYIGLERFLADVDYDTVTVYAYDATGNVLSEYTENLTITHTDATVTITGAYVESLADYGGVFFSEALSSSYALSFYDADGNKLEFQNWMTAGSAVSALYEHSGYSLDDVAFAEIASSKSVAVTEADGVSNLNITTVGSNRVTLTEYPDAMRLGAASNPHIDEFNCLAWDEPSGLPIEHYYELALRTADGTWTEVGTIGGNIYAVGSLPTGTYDKIRLYTVPGWDYRASYGYGIFEADYALTVGGSAGEGEDESVLPAVTDVAFTEDDYWGLRVTFTEPSSNFSPRYQLYLYNGTEWKGPLAKSYRGCFDLIDTELEAGTYTKIRILSTTERDGYTDGVYEADCSLTVHVTESSANIRFVTIGEDVFCYVGGAPANTSLRMYWSTTPSMIDSNMRWGFSTDSTGQALGQYGTVDFDKYYRILVMDAHTVTDATTASFAYTSLTDWAQPTEYEGTSTDFITSAGFMEVKNIPSFAFTTSLSNIWQNVVCFSADGGNAWIGANIFESSSVELYALPLFEVEETTTYNKVRILSLANGNIYEYIADCNLTVTHAGSLTLPAPSIVYNGYSGYDIVFKDGFPANTGYLYDCEDGSGVEINHSGATTDIEFRIGKDTRKDYAGYTVRIQLLSNVIMDGMTCNATISDSGTIDVYTAAASAVNPEDLGELRTGQLTGTSGSNQTVTINGSTYKFSENGYTLYNADMIYSIISNFEAPKDNVQYVLVNGKIYFLAAL